MTPQSPKILRRRGTRFWTWVLVILSLVAIVIVVPVAVVLARKRDKGPPTNVLLPLYIYPEGDAWKPLYDAATHYSNINFTVVVNPQDGPGTPPYPTADYATAIARLNGFTNVQGVGYAKTTYGTRANASVVADIQTYAGWENYTDADVSMKGIFFDEAPSQGGTNVTDYLVNITSTAKEQQGIQSPKITIQNPGVVPSESLSNSYTDITVIYEGTYANMPTLSDMHTMVKPLNRKRSNYAYLVHSLPQGMKVSDLRKLVQQISQVAEYVFITDLTDDYYANFGSRWTDFLSAIPS